MRGKAVSRRQVMYTREALGKDPPAKEDCQICFLPIPVDCCHDSTEVGGSVAVW